MFIDRFECFVVDCLRTDLDALCYLLYAYATRFVTWFRFDCCLLCLF